MKKTKISNMKMGKEGRQRDGGTKNDDKNNNKNNNTKKTTTTTTTSSSSSSFVMMSYRNLFFLIIIIILLICQYHNSFMMTTSTMMTATRTTTKYWDVMVGSQQQDFTSEGKRGNNALAFLPIQYLQFPTTPKKQPKINNNTNNSTTHIYNGTFDPNTGILVVNINTRVMYWLEGQSRLCEILQQMTNYTYSHYDDNNDDNKTSMMNVQIKKRIINATMDCIRPSVTGYGQGNWITAIYAVRLASAMAGIDFQLQCMEGTSFPLKSLLPWYTGYRIAPKRQQLYPWYSPSSSSSYEGDADDGMHNDEITKMSWPLDCHTDGPTMKEQICSNENKYIRIDMVVKEIIHDTRKMVQTLIGHTKQYQEQYHKQETTAMTTIVEAEEQQLSVPRITTLANIHGDIDNNNNNVNYFDDVVIHFRCGDIMGGRIRPDYGILKYTSYMKYINVEETKSIGIVTQPFTIQHNRQNDIEKINHCQNATNVLVQYLYTAIRNNKKKKKNDNNNKEGDTRNEDQSGKNHNNDENENDDIKISIHNDEKETLPYVYVRLVMAKQAFVSLSSFGIFPVISTYGVGYYQKGNAGVNAWVNNLIGNNGNDKNKNKNNQEEYTFFDNDDDDDSATKNTDLQLIQMNEPYLSSGKIARMKFDDVLKWFVQ